MEVAVKFRERRAEEADCGRDANRSFGTQGAKGPLLPSTRAALRTWTGQSTSACTRDCERAAYRHPRAGLVHALAGELVDDRQRRRAQQSVSKELLIANGQARSTWIYTSLCVVRSIPGITARRRCKNKNRACRAKTKKTLAKQKANRMSHWYLGSTMLRS